MKDRWLVHFIELAKQKALMSRDADTKVGSVIVSEEDMVEVSSGYNDLPRGVLHTKERNSRPLKYLFTAHSEANSIANAARMGRSTKDTTLISTLFPCNQCAALIINAGITKVVSPPVDFTHYKYGAEWQNSLDMFKEVGITVYFEDFIK